MVNVGSSLTYLDQNYPDYESGLRIRITDPVLQIHDYGSGLRIWITDQVYGPGLRIWITNQVYESGLRNTDRDYFVHDRLKMDQE